MKLKNLNKTLFILIALIFASLGFFVVAEENSKTANNIFLDSDQDGLTNEEEKSYGTDPKNSDTDGDGYSDGAEISAGYNPLKRAPGDKLTSDEKPKMLAKNQLNSDEKENLTQKVSQELATLLSNSEKENITMDDIQTIFDSTIENDKEEIPKISKDEIRIKKQNYGNLSAEKKKEQKKKDATNYFVAVSYVLISNSPEPLTSSNDFSSVMNKVIRKLVSAFELRDPSGLEDLSRSGEKVLEQLKEIEVPEDLVDVQINALQYATYAKNLKASIKSNPKDPIETMLNYTKIQSFIESFIGFYDEMQKKFDEYEIEYSEVQDKIENYGIKLPANEN